MLLVGATVVVVVNDDASTCVSFNKVPSVISRPFTSTILALAIKLDSALPSIYTNVPLL